MCDSQIPSEKPVSQNSGPAAKCTFPYIQKGEATGFNAHHHSTIYIQYIRGSMTLSSCFYKHVKTDQWHSFPPWASPCMTTLPRMPPAAELSDVFQVCWCPFKLTWYAALGSISPVCKHKQIFSICPHSYWSPAYCVFLVLCIYSCRPSGPHDMIMSLSTRNDPEHDCGGMIAFQSWSEA